MELALPASAIRRRLRWVLGVAVDFQLEDPAVVVVPRGHRLRVITRIALVGRSPWVVTAHIRRIMLAAGRGSIRDHNLAAIYAKTGTPTPVGVASIPALPLLISAALSLPRSRRLEDAASRSCGCRHRQRFTSRLARRIRSEARRITHLGGSRDPRAWPSHPGCGPRGPWLTSVGASGWPMNRPGFDGRAAFPTQALALAEVGGGRDGPGDDADEVGHRRAGLDG